MIIFFYGPNDFRAKQKINELKEKFSREIDPDGQSFKAINCENTDLADIARDINTGSLFTKKRLTLLENIFANKKPEFLKDFLNYLESNSLEKSEDIILIYEPKIKTEKGKIVKINASEDKNNALNAKEKKLFDFLRQQKFTQEFEPLSPLETAKWIKKELEKFDGKINSQAERMLIGITNGDLWQLNNEINKLAHLKQKEEINVSDIEQICSRAFDDNIFALTDALGTKNKSLAVKILEEQYELGAKNEYLLTMMLRQLKIILQIKSATEKGISPASIATSIGLHPYVAQKSAEQTGYFSFSQLKNIISELTHLDYLNKTGQTDFKTGLDLIIAKI